MQARFRVQLLGLDIKNKDLTFLIPIAVGIQIVDHLMRNSTQS